MTVTSHPMKKDPAVEKKAVLKVREYHLVTGVSFFVQIILRSQETEKKKDS